MRHYKDEFSNKWNQQKNHSLLIINKNKNSHELSTKQLLNKVNRHNISKKVTRLLREKIEERPNITKSDLDKALELYSLSLSNLKDLPKLRRIKNFRELTKDDLIYTLLRSEEVPQENNYLKYINNTRNSDLRDRINHARMMTTKLGDILTNKEGHEIRKELYHMTKTKYTKITKEKAIARLIELTKDLYYKQKSHQPLSWENLLCNKRCRTFVQW